jgi:hypothetical protein
MAINDERLNFAGTTIDKQSLPMNMLDLEGKKILIWPETARSSDPANVVIADPRTKM